MPRPIALAAALVLVVVLLVVAAARLPAPATAQAPAAEPPAAEESGAVGRTPPRLSFLDGQVSFWRPGAEEWTQARLNTALAPGDELYTGAPGNLESQMGARAWVRAWGRTQVGLAGLEPDFVQLKVTTGHVSVDLRRLDPGHTVEVDTPNAAFTIEHVGYYRITVTDGRTSFITRRGGRATVTLPTGTTAALAASEEAVVEGADAPQVATWVAPELDAWDRWNYARTDALLDSLSRRYVAGEVYGIDDLDQHGSWRVVETYGAVWVPTTVPVGWVPYSVGSWIWDPYYSWTWVDAAPWGWAPFHYGRWVYVGGVWGWAPGPLVVRPVYAPALVTFLAPSVSVTIGIGVPPIGWLALGWGEPVVPWWGPVGFIGVPRWVGWGGPRHPHPREVHAYRNAGVRNAVIAVSRERFGRGPVSQVRPGPDPRTLEPIRGKPDLPPARASLVPDSARGVRPPEAAVRRPVVATRPPEDPGRWLKPHGIQEPARTPAASPRLVPPPGRAATPDGAPRPPFGASPIERPRGTPPPRPGPAQPPAPGARPAPSAPPAKPAPAAPSAPRGTTPRAETPRPSPPPGTTAPRAEPTTPRVEPSRPATPPSTPRAEPSRPATPPGATAPRAEPARPSSPPSATSPRAEPARPATPPKAAAPRAQAPPTPPAARMPAQPTTPRAQSPGGPSRLPGQPANRLYPGRSQAPARVAPPSDRAPAAAPARPAPAQRPGSSARER